MRTAVVIGYEDLGCGCRRTLVLVTEDGNTVRFLAGGGGQPPFWSVLDEDRQVAAPGAQEVTLHGLAAPATWSLRAGGITSTLALPVPFEEDLDALVADLVGRAGA